ncbi:MAG: VanZ family protein [Rhizobiales bacterium]|nr:VanZ family protein [Hyphomicrobiales bacterium]MBN9010048.1 VanZ family protein [Hyphomicrobiales bacterium]
MSLITRLHSSRAGRALIATCVILITALSLIPGSWQERTGLPGPVEHFIAYSGTGFILAVVLPRRLLWPATALLAGYSGVMEILQNFSPGRDPAVFDFIISSAGAFFGAGLGWVIFHRRIGSDGL